MTNSFVNQIENGYTPLEEEENVYDSIFKEYERVVIKSLITSFGLDFLVKDQHGGDVDTVHNVRQVGKDEQMTYTNRHNKKKYDDMPKYSRAIHDDWHKKGENFAKTKRQAREEYQSSGKLVKDEYENFSLYITKAKGIPANKQAELDHIISTHEIYTDRGRVLSGVDGKELADMRTNFAWTNKSRNASMGKKTNLEYVETHPKLDEDTKRQMLEKDKEARKAYDAKINVAYYTNSAFFKDTTKAATKVGVAMGLRQALGLVFSEIWFAVKDEIKARKENGKALFNSIAEGVKKGYENAKVKYEEIWHKFIEGTVAGILSSIITTLCNIFFTTAKSLVRIMRQTWASLVEATKILLFNPDCLPFGERFKAATKIIAAGASVVVGTMVGDMIAKTGIEAIPVVGEIVPLFCSTLVTGIMSCSLLYLLDHNSTINKLVKVLNSIPTVDDFVIYYRMQAQLLDEYCAKLMDINLERFQNETASYCDIVTVLEKTNNQQELNIALRDIYKKLDFKSPFGENEDIHSFMSDKNSKLTFC